LARMETWATEGTLQNLTVVEGSARLGNYMASFRRLGSLGRGVLTILVLLSLSFQAKAITLNFQNLLHTEIDFSGGAFSFTSTNGYQFAISTVTNGIGDSIGNLGYVSPGGPFTIGTITSNNVPFVGLIESAPVSGTGILHITDSSSNDLTGTIVWSNIVTVAGTGGAINLNGVVNLTGINYSGSGSDLGALAAAGSATDVITFQFTPPQQLDQLKASSGSFTSYSGSIFAVPEPGTWVLVAMGVGLGVFLRGRRHVRG